MSQDVSTSSSASEPAPPSESVAPPSKKGKKNLLLMIVAIVVAIALIASVVIVMVLPKDEEEPIGLTLSSAMNPSGTITVAAGGPVVLAVNSTLSNETEDIEYDIDSWTNVTYRWSMDDSDLGSFNLLAKRSVIFTGATEAMTGTITCTVTYDDAVVVVEADVEVSPPYLDVVSVSPSSRTLAQDDSVVLTAEARDSVGGTMTGVTFTWSVWNMSSGDYDLNATTGPSVTFTGLAEGKAYVNASATVGGITRAGTSIVTVGETPERSIDYYWYDMFDVPFGEWWDMRWDVYGTEEPITDSYPYIFKWYGSQEGNFWWYTNMRMNLTGRNMPELNMQDNPEFLPFLGDARGGTATIDWYMQYLTEDEMSRYPDATIAWLDGWVIALNGTVTLDEQAAMSVMGITAEGLEDFDTWWDVNNATFNQAYLDWVKYEGGRYRLDIYNMYEYPLTFLTHKIWAEKVGDEVVLHYDTVSWGMEAMLTRWMHEAFMPTEWYFEDTNFHAVIGPERADLDMDTAVVYAAYAYETTLEAEPCWEWEALLGDYVASSVAHPVSDYDIYADQTYLMLSPGSPLYGDMMIYDYAPGAWNLSEGETLVVEWPSGDQMFYRHGGDDIVYEEFGPMRVDYAEPMGTDFPGQVLIDQDARTISFIGPIDSWTWSKEQTAHENLANEWDRLGILPYGCPTIELRRAGLPEPARFDVVASPSSVETGDAVSLTVTVLDQYGEVYTAYTGTVTFESSDLAADPHADYTFLVGDSGVATFTDEFVFNTAGIQTITVRDTLNENLFGTSNDVTVAEAPVATEMVIGGVASPILLGTPSDFTVQVLDQFGNLYTDYLGTVTFSSNDTAAVFPDDPYTFTALDAGEHLFADGVTFGTAGVHDATVVDSVDPLLSDSQLDIVVLELHFEMTYDPVLVIANETEVTLTVSVMDQYGDVYVDYLGMVEFASDDIYVTLPAVAEFTALDAGVKEVTGLMLGTPGLQTVTATDQADSTITGDVDVLVGAEAAATLFELTDVSETCRNGVPETVTVTVLDQYERVFTGYDGTVHFSSTDPLATVPPDYAFVPATDLGVHEFTDGVIFNTDGTWELTCEDDSDPLIFGTVEVFVTSEVLTIGSFTVEDIASGEWAGNESSVTVTAYDQFDNLFDDYIGTVTFSTNATGSYELPSDYTFVLADNGMKSLSVVRFDEPGTYNVTASDTLDPTAKGSQEDILVTERPYAASLEITGYPTDAFVGEGFSLTVTVYDQWDDVFVWYDGTVEFTSTDGAADLPDDYTFTALDRGVHEFDGIVLMTAGSPTITVTDMADSLVTDETDPIIVTVPPEREVEFKVYDMFAEPWGVWWDDPDWGRYVYYGDSLMLTRGDYNTMLYMPDYSVTIPKRYQGIIMAPYRLAIDGNNLTELDVTSPEFMPVLGSGTGEGASAQVEVYMQYLDPTWWDSYWVPTWSSNAGWDTKYTFPNAASEGYELGTVYEVTMNREAAELWLGMPQSATPSVWWTANSAAYRTAWENWILYEGTDRLDVYNGFDWDYVNFQVVVSMSVDGDGNIVLNIGHVSWGYEVLMCRWLDDKAILNHQPWYEDLTLSVEYGEDLTNLTMDAVCQFSMHAVKANETVEDAAWVWEAIRIDYIESSTNHPGSEFDPYADLTYTSWNAGDECFGELVAYDTTPGLFELDEGERLVFELPTGNDVIGFEGKAVPPGSNSALAIGDTSAFDDIMVAGEMELGYYVTNPAAPINLDSMYVDDGVTKTLTIAGPQTFDQVKWPSGALYHGSPWIEFNVVPAKLLSSEPAEPMEASASSAVVVVGAASTGAFVSMTAVVCAAMVAVVALGVGRRFN